MNFLWKDYLLVATEWTSGTSSSSYPHAVYRSAISRAYYAVFHAAFNLAQSLGMEETGSASDHYRLRKFFEGRGRVAQQLTLLLRSLYDLRISADYVLDAYDQVSVEPQIAAQRAVNMAYKALETVEYLKSARKP
jgi:uncharacterized protein (UPF0332 family)